jgi:hypothetical protein
LKEGLHKVMNVSFPKVWVPRGKKREVGDIFSGEWESVDEGL